MMGALIGFLVGAYLSDAIGRKWTFFISAVATFVMVMLFMFVPMGNTMLLLVGVPLSASILMKFSPMGPYMTELYPTEIRGTGQGFCYNAGRALGSVFMTAIGFATAIMSLGNAIVIFSTIAHALMIVMLLMLQVVATMQMFIESFVLTNGGGGVGDNTLSVVMLIYQYAFAMSGASNYNSASALGVVLMLVLAVFSGGFLWVTRERG